MSIDLCLFENEGKWTGFFFKNIYYCGLKVGETKLLLCPQLFFSNFFVGKINLENNTVIVQKTKLMEAIFSGSEDQNIVLLAILFFQCRGTYVWNIANI